MKILRVLQLVFSFEERIHGEREKLSPKEVLLIMLLASPLFVQPIINGCSSMCLGMLYSLSREYSLFYFLLL